MFILAILVFGLFIGWLAQLVLGMGTKPDGQALVAGILGSFVGGMIGNVLAGDDFRIRPSGFIGSFVGAVIVLLIWRAISARSAH